MGVARHGDDNVLFVGYLGTGNLGNDVSLAVMVDAFGRRHHGPRMRILSFGPAGTTTSGLPITSLPLSRTTPLGRISHVADRVTVKIRDLVSMTRLLLRARHVVVPGSGTLESGLGGGVWGLPWALAATAVLAKLTRTQMHLVAVGADPPTNPRIKFLNRLTTRLAASRSFRDQLSREAVAGLGVDTADDPVVPDLAFSRTSASFDHASGQAPRGRVGLSVQAWHGHANDWSAGQSAHRDYIAVIGRVAAGLLDEGFTVTLLLGDGVDETVFEPIRREVAKHGHAPDAVNTHASPTFDDLVEVMAAHDIIIGCRYHSLVGAVVAARPIISLGYGPKHRELMEELGLEAWAHDITAVDAEMVIRQVRQALSTHAQTTPELHQEALRRAALVEAHLDDVVARLAGPAPTPSSYGAHR